MAQTFTEQLANARRQVREYGAAVANYEADCGQDFHELPGGYFRALESLQEWAAEVARLAPLARVTIQSAAVAPGMVVLSQGIRWIVKENTVYPGGPNRDDAQRILTADAHAEDLQRAGSYGKDMHLGMRPDATVMLSV